MLLNPTFTNSEFRKLADVSRNNMLDVSEFAVAMHLIQSRLKGVNIPERLPETLPPVSGPRIEVPAILRDERYAYKKAFLWKDKACTGYIDGREVDRFQAKMKVLTLIHS